MKFIKSQTKFHGNLRNLIPLPNYSSPSLTTRKLNFPLMPTKVSRVLLFRGFFIPRVSLLIKRYIIFPIPN